MVSRRAGLPRRMLSEFRAGGTNVFQIIYEEEYNEPLLMLASNFPSEGSELAKRFFRFFGSKRL